MTYAITYKIFITTKEGHNAEVIGHERAIDEIEAALYTAGFRENEEIGCWDKGFYSSTPRPRTRRNV